MTWRRSTSAHDNISFVLPTTTKYPIVLGLPWIQRHNPHISWSDKEILWWFQCYATCLKVPSVTIATNSVESPETDFKFEFLSVYQDFKEVFSKAKMSGRPPHRPCDGAGNHIYISGSLATKNKAMEEYIEEALKQGDIWISEGNEWKTAFRTTSGCLHHAIWILLHTISSKLN